MGDDDKDNDSIFKRANDDLMRITNMDRMSEMAKDPSLKKHVFNSLFQFYHEMDKKEKQKKDEAISIFTKLIFEENIEDASIILKNNCFLKNEIKVDASCAIRGKWNSVLFLIENNFPVNQELVQENDNLLAIAINQNKFEVVSKLKNSKYDFNKKNKVHRSIRQEIMEYGKKETLDVLKNEYNFNFINEFRTEFEAYTIKSFENLQEYLSYDEWSELNKKMRDNISDYKESVVTDQSMIKSVEKTIKVVDEHLKRMYLLKSL